MYNKINFTFKLTLYEKGFISQIDEILLQFFELSLIKINNINNQSHQMVYQQSSLPINVGGNILQVNTFMYGLMFVNNNNESRFIIHLPLRINDIERLYGEIILPRLNAPEAPEVEVMEEDEI